MSGVRWSGVSRSDGSLVKAAYMYFMSFSNASLAFSLFDELLDKPILDHKELMPDMTLRMLDTEWIESPSLRPVGCL